MDNLYKKNLKILWDYTHLNQIIEKSDLIIGCGSGDLKVPVKCANILKEGYAPLILFCGGFGKITKDILKKPEAIIYKDIAIKEGIAKENILTEDKSTNTGDNFKYALKKLEEKHIKHDKIIIVHGPFSERRTLATAKTIFKNQKLSITSTDITFDEYLEFLQNNEDKEMNVISVIVSDVQKMIIYPQIGFQVEENVPKNVLKAYYFFKNLGFDKYILSKEEFDDLVLKYGHITNKKINYFS